MRTIESKKKVMNDGRGAPDRSDSNHDGFMTTEVILPGIIEPSGLRIERRALDSPLPRQAIVNVEATGISFAERAMRRGIYYGQPAFPFVPGYDLVGIVAAVGRDVDASLVGKRVAALTKTGGWASAVLVSADELMPLPEGVDAGEAETLIVSGITAWQMLHREAHIRRGQTIVVHGANGSVGSTLVQLAQHAGVRVIGTASPRHHDALRAIGVLPIDYGDTDLTRRVREIAPEGVDAVFDHVGGKSVSTSYHMLNARGTLVCYAIASALDNSGSMLQQYLRLLAQLAWWNMLPNGHKAVFYNIWTGYSGKDAAKNEPFQARLREDFAHLMDLLTRGILKPHVAARFPLDQIVAAVELAESRTVYGKVVLIPH